MLKINITSIQNLIICLWFYISFFFKTLFPGLAYLLKLVGLGRDKSSPVFSLKIMYACIYIDGKHTTYVAFIYNIKQENIFLIPGTGIGLGKPRDDIMASPLYPIVVVEMLATPPTTGVQYQTHYAAFKQVRL